MSKAAFFTSYRLSRGFTAIDALIAAAVFFVLLSAAVPALKQDTARDDLAEAAFQIQHCIDTARETARLNGAEVRVDFKSYVGDPARFVTFHSPALTAGLALPEYRLPAAVELVADREVFEFDRRGAVRNAGTIVLVSKVDESVSETVKVI